MSRTNINYDKKRDELAKQVFDIFLQYGYETTTLSFIMKKLNISKGAFYHYFSTKEECADSAVALYSRDCCEKLIDQIDNNVSAEVNFKNLCYSCFELFKDNEKRMEKINTPSNAIFHQKLMAALVKALAPLYAKVIVQGVHDEIFTAKYPLETAQMILTLSNFYFDADLFGWEAQEMPVKLRAFEDFLTHALDAKPGSFSFFHSL
ncbi:TetR/AcrR family transcriptional regulator [Gorillibacterium massiliense]|uniref:TetR/AcrR family transcriptional regulator n=1 Tax=Gorillibacterium massiliense TaxID=1280390 RepID=UPI0004B699B1|nr:TetR/AcrR family transcriptional regulator [Gorillibacterium massiliense]